MLCVFVRVELVELAEHRLYNMCGSLWGQGKPIGSNPWTEITSVGEVNTYRTCIKQYSEGSFGEIAEHRVVSLLLYEKKFNKDVYKMPIWEGQRVFEKLTYQVNETGVMVKLDLMKKPIFLIDFFKKLWYNKYIRNEKVIYASLV